MAAGILFEKDYDVTSQLKSRVMGLISNVCLGFKRGEYQPVC